MSAVLAMGCSRLHSLRHACNMRHADAVRHACNMRHADAVRHACNMRHADAVRQRTEHRNMWCFRCPGHQSICGIEMQLHSFVTSTLDVSCQLHAPAALPARYPSSSTLGGPHWRSVARAAIELRVSECPASSLVTKQNWAIVHKTVYRGSVVRLTAPTTAPTVHSSGTAEQHSCCPLWRHQTWQMEQRHLKRWGRRILRRSWQETANTAHLANICTNDTA